MKRHIFLFLFMFFALQTVMAQSTQPSAGCSISDGCFDYTLNGATRHDDDTYILSFTLKVNCNSRLEYIAFQLPEGADADEPSNYFATQKDFIVYDGKTSGNKIETNFNAIQFTAKNNVNISNGATVTLEFPIALADYNAMNNIQVQAKVAGATPSLISFDLKACAPLPLAPGQRPMPECRIDLGSAVFGFMEAIDNGDGTTTVAFMIQNNMAGNTESVTIEIPGAPENVTAAGDNNGAAYHANYKYKTTYEGGVFTFEAQNTAGFADGAMDYFMLTMPTQAYEADQNFMLTLTANGTTVNTGFNTTTCEDEAITPLPVELVSFNGKATQSGIELTWSTASETNNDHFKVEHSENGNTFEVLAEVEGAGNSNTKLNYNYTDPTTKQGIHYYRIRQVDYDGTSSLSKTIAVKNVAFSGNMEVFPNPAAGQQVTISLAGTGADLNGGVIQITDMGGKEKYKHIINAGTRDVTVSLTDLNIRKGLYIVNLLQGDTKQTKKLIIQ